ncbi:uncharacterized protein LAJ45_00627 [Morchella importuna]|uniref:uncharacterized protein n=1 Tax=Morchella importuna TaxID=1174673 RepID=UPI001E8CF688|nr:uncharacterized protein LAJ45_00627 [Morchella importuna]KAH8155617.1 hypothetical protein LAJ45_00627 [Morchella importuna]
MDIWGNVKIPKLESLNQSTSDIDSWVQVPKNQNISYVSLIGVPMAGTELIRQTFSKFTIQYTYFNWDCTKPDNRTISDPWFAEIGINVNKTLNFNVQPYRSSMFVRMPTVRRKLGLVYLDPARFLYVSRINEGDSVDYPGISNLWRWLTTSNCSVTRLRPYVTIAQRPATHTALDGTDDSVITGFSDTNRQPNVVRYTILATATERFIQDPDTVTRISNHDFELATASDGLLTNISSLSKETFQTRFGLAFNSYYTGTLAPSYIAGTPLSFDELLAFDSSDSAYLTPDEPRRYNHTLTGPMAMRLPGNHTFIARETSTKFVFQEKKYVCDKMWLWILVATTAVLIIAAHLGTYLKCMSVAPDILGSVSSLTRDNPYIPLPGGGCILEGAERTRLLAGLEVRVVDVRPNEEVGHIALSSLKDGVKPLVKGRLYMDS